MKRKYFGFRGDVIRLAEPRRFDELPVERNLWHETQEEQDRVQMRAVRNRRLLQWVRAEMETSLTEQEGRCIRLHYLEGLSYAEAGECLGRDRTTVYHNVRRGIAKLRTAARLAGLIPGEPQANAALDCDPPTDI